MWSHSFQGPKTSDGRQAAQNSHSVLWIRPSGGSTLQHQPRRARREPPIFNSVAAQQEGVCPSRFVDG